MKEQHKAFQVRLMSTEKQEEFEQHAECARLVYNWSLNEKIEARKEASRRLDCWRL